MRKTYTFGGIQFRIYDALIVIYVNGKYVDYSFNPGFALFLRERAERDGE